MYEHLRCIALRTVKYDDRRAIVAAWSAERGRVSFLVPDGAGREARRRRALMMPLCMFEGESDIRPGRELLSIRDLRPLEVLPDVASNPSKVVVAMFVAEVLERLLRQAAPDDILTEFIFRSVRLLDSLTSAVAVANFPILFLFRLCTFLGIEPDCSDAAPGRIFDMREGRFRLSPPSAGRWLSPRDSRWVALLHRLPPERGALLRIGVETRRAVLSRILEYYSMHIASLDGLQSPDILSFR